MSNLNVNKIDDFRGFDIIISHKYKFIYCLIQKCGSSSILYSIYKHEYNKEYNANEIIWEQIRYNKKLHNLDKIHFSFKKIEDLINFSNEFKDYRKFIVIRDVKERFISWLNFAHFLILKFNLPENNEKEYIFYNMVEIYNKIYNDYHKSFIESSFLNQNKIEYHCLPQTVFYNFFKNAFQDKLEIVELNNLKQYLHDNYGFELIKNNENNNKFITINNLSKSELSIIDNISLHDNIWDIIKTQNQQ